MKGIAAFEPTSVAVGLFVGEKVVLCCAAKPPRLLKLKSRQVTKCLTGWLRRNKHVLVDVLAEEFLDSTVTILGSHSVSLGLASLALYVLLFIFIWIA